MTKTNIEKFECGCIVEHYDNEKMELHSCNEDMDDDELVNYFQSMANELQKRNFKPTDYI